MSSATWSFRLRAVWSRPPTSIPYLAMRLIFYIGVHIFERGVELKFPRLPGTLDFLQTPDERPGFAPGENVLPAKHDHVSPAPPEVIRDQPLIRGRDSPDIPAGGEFFGQGRGPLFRSFSPEFSVGFHKFIIVGTQIYADKRSQIQKSSVILLLKAGNSSPHLKGRLVFLPFIRFICVHRRPNN